MTAQAETITWWSSLYTKERGRRIARTTSDGEQRLEAMVRTTDGFELAEVDLDLRGEGTVFGERQKGTSDLRLASLRRDKAVVAQARRLAERLLDEDPGLAGHPVLADEVRLVVGDDGAEWLSKS